jgi:hypothetical protein
VSIRPLGIVENMPFEEYLAVDAVSSTGLKLFARSAWHYKNRVDIDPTPSMLRGTLAHCAVLEPDALSQRYAVTPEDAPRRPSRAQWEAKNPSPESLEAMRCSSGESRAVMPLPVTMEPPNCPRASAEKSTTLSR